MDKKMGGACARTTAVIAQLLLFRTRLIRFSGQTYRIQFRSDSVLIDFGSVSSVGTDSKPRKQFIPLFDGWMDC